MEARIETITEANRASWNLIAPRRPHTDHDDAKLPRGARGELDAPRFSTFVWPVSDVVMAFVRAGLRLDAFIESPEPGLYSGLGEAADALPAYYVIKATKAGTG
jgi:hypothetical protein